MRRLSLFAWASVFAGRVLAASVQLHPRSPVPQGWENILCLLDYGVFGSPVLTGAYHSDYTGMTIEKCVAFCDSQSTSFRFMGLANGYECSCGNFFDNYYEDVGLSSCSSWPCNGDPSEVGGCGGLYAASMYQRINSNFIIPALVPSVGLWNGLGCYNDSVSARALQVRVEAGSTTVGSCVAACQAQGFSLAGVEFGRECWCGSQLQHGSTFFGNDNGIQHGNFRQNPNALHCNMGCQGNPSETCGGPALLNLYNFTGTYPIGASVVPAVDGWTSRGCHSDTVSSRTLEQRIDVGSVTAESCVNVCQSQSFSIAGLEYAQECWCGNEIKSPGAPISQSACNQACVGDASEVCGGPNALQIYY
ncbi:WSC domain-containing protein [Lactarius pseudohatsudake]|nr:WSC domain-containing protein [Lactarius pseudohatsudake]